MSMRKIVARVVVVCLCTLVAAIAEDKPAVPGPVRGDTGEIVGTITQVDHGKVTVKGEAGEMVLMPFWRGGMPKDGGGFDKDMLKKLENFKVGDKVKVSWIFEEHARINSIEKTP